MIQAPTIPFEVKAVIAYQARNSNELSLEIGKIYRVIATDGRDVWWKSKSDSGQFCWFPANYTQVIESHEQHQAQISVTSQPNNGLAFLPHTSQITTAINGQVVPNEREKPAKLSCDPALTKMPLKEVLPCVVTLHIVESIHNTTNGKTPHLFVSKRSIIDSDRDKKKPMFSSSIKAKSGTWKWNEEFKIYIKDAEQEVILVQFASKDSKKFYGEIEFPLRAAVRKFDKPNGQFNWFGLKNGNDKVGDVLLFIEFEDPRPFSGPSNFNHTGHVGFENGSFDVRNVPSEWKRILPIIKIKDNIDPKPPSLPVNRDTKLPSLPVGGDPKPPTLPVNADPKPPTPPINRDPKLPSLPVNIDHKPPSLPVNIDPKLPSLPVGGDHKPPSLPVNIDHKPPTLPVNIDHKLPKPPVNTDIKPLAQPPITSSIPPPPPLMKDAVSQLPVPPPIAAPSGISLKEQLEKISLNPTQPKTQSKVYNIPSSSLEDILKSAITKKRPDFDGTYDIKDNDEWED